MGAPFDFDRSWTFPQGADELWATLSQTGEYSTWWRWLRTFDATGLDLGATARCVIQAPLPYRLDLTIDIVDVVPGRLVDTQVSGDLAGPARLELTDLGDRLTEARLVWSLSLESTWLGRLERFTRPAMVWAHDRVVEIGVQQFRDVALEP